MARRLADAVPGLDHSAVGRSRSVDYLTFRFQADYFRSRYSSSSLGSFANVAGSLAAEPRSENPRDS